LLEAPPKFVFEWETAHGDFKFGVENLTGSRILAISVHSQHKIGQKYMKTWSNFQNFSTYRKSGTEKSNLRSNFTPKVV